MTLGNLIVQKNGFKTRGQAQADNINEKGITLNLASESEEIIGITAVVEIAALKACDAIVITLKSYDTEDAAQELTKTMVKILQSCRFKIVCKL